MQLTPQAVAQLLLALPPFAAERRDQATVRHHIGLHARRLDGAQRPQRAVHLTGLWRSPLLSIDRRLGLCTKAMDCGKMLAPMQSSACVSGRPASPTVGTPYGHLDGAGDEALIGRVGVWLLLNGLH